MATDGSTYWDDERYSSSGRDSDDSPILSYRYEKYRRYSSYTSEDKAEEKDKRSTLTVLAKFFLFSSAMILFCVLMYIPVYNKANYHMPKAIVAGWSVKQNRDTKIYIQPNNLTVAHEPQDVCTKNKQNEKNKLFLLIIVCSSTVNFERRVAIRESWGSQANYYRNSKVFNTIHDRYKNYNYTYDLYTDDSKNNGSNDTVAKRTRRDISRFSELIPELAKALKTNLEDVKTDVGVNDEEKRFEDDDEEVMLPEFDMNKVLGEQTEKEPDYDYDNEESDNIMKIPPKGSEHSQNLGKILSMLKRTSLPENGEILESGNTEPEFKVVFLLGLPSQESDNDTDVQSRIDDEVDKYRDVIQEGFIDSYNNLTLKSIMMLKWVSNNCNGSVRYILKTDDDMYINVPNLIDNLRNRSKHFDKALLRKPTDKEYLLIGDLICGARPVLDSSNKWYSPKYMYSGRVYPRYLSGTGYLLSSPAASALYKAALVTNYFHLEDIYITGMCSMRAHPRIVPTDDPQFSYVAARGVRAGVAGAGAGGGACSAHAHVTSHRVAAQELAGLAAALADPDIVDRCERERLTQVRRDRMKPKTSPKKIRKIFPHRS